MKRITFNNIAEVGKFVKDSTWGNANEIIPAEIYEVEQGDGEPSIYYKKCLPSWMKDGKLERMTYEKHSSELDEIYIDIELLAAQRAYKKEHGYAHS